MHRSSLILIWSCVLAACSQNPAVPLHKKLDAEALTHYEVSTEQHRLLIAHNKGESYSSGTLRVYLEGDGTPWSASNEITENPTSRELLSLKLMLRDPVRSVYLNRPCYGHLTMPENCDERLWTSARYSFDVVFAMSQALDKLKQRFEVDNFTLIGHSGGGTLAILIASFRDDVSEVVTIAGNLNHEAWTHHFGYLPLHESINPVDVLPLGDHIQRRHFVGLKDANVPSAIILSAIEKDTGSSVTTYEHFDHVCCWEKSWPEIMDGTTNNQNHYGSF